MIQALFYYPALGRVHHYSVQEEVIEMKSRLSLHFSNIGVNYKQTAGTAEKHVAISQGQCGMCRQFTLDYIVVIGKMKHLSVAILIQSVGCSRPDGTVRRLREGENALAGNFIHSSEHSPLRVEPEDSV